MPQKDRPILPHTMAVAEFQPHTMAVPEFQPIHTMATPEFQPQVTPITKEATIRVALSTVASARRRRRREVSINYFFAHHGGRKFHMLANLDIINTACVGVTVQLQVAQNWSLVRGGARGRGRGRGARPARPHVVGPTRPLQSAVLYGVLLVPGRETVVVVDVDAVVALMGVVYCGQDGYLVRRDSCFHHDSR